MYHLQRHLLSFAMEIMRLLMDMRQVRAQRMQLGLLILVQHSVQKQEHMKLLVTNKKSDTRLIRRICGLVKNKFL